MATGQLPAAVSGDRRVTERRAGPLSYYVAGRGAPLLLIHSINAAASAYEVKTIFEGMAGERRVYAPDLPGFGFSDRSDRDYDPALYTAAILDMLDVIAGEAGATPVDAVALSLPSEYLARAAMHRPERFRSLTLITPTGFQRGSARRRGPPGSTREIPGLYPALRVPLWSQGLYDLLVSRKSIRYFLKRTFGSDAVPEEMVDYDHLTAHQPGARFAPLAFLSGRLFSGDVRTVYEKLTLPVWVPHATRGDFRDFSDAGWTEPRRNWLLQPCPTGALVHVERPAEFLADFRRFLDGGVRARSAPGG